MSQLIRLNYTTGADRRRWMVLAVLSAWVLLAAVGLAKSFGADVTREVVAGESITLDAGQVATFEIPNRSTVKGAKSASVRYETPGVRSIKVTPAPYTVTPPPYTIRLNVTPATPTTKPSTQPTPPVDPTPPAGQQIVYVRGGGTITARSNTRFVGVPSEDGSRPVVRGDVGVKIPTGTRNASFAGIDFKGSGDNGDGVYGVTRGFEGVGFTDCSFDNFRAGFTIHREGASSSRAKDVSFLRVAFTRMQGRGDKEGHGGFAGEVDGLTIRNCLIEGAGGAKSWRHIFVHGFYIQAGCTRVVVDANLFAYCESVGVQARGSLSRWDARDDEKDPGPIITGNVFIDCPIAVMVNGPRATVRDNVHLAGAKHDKSVGGHGGQTVYASVGELRTSGNLRVRDAADATAKLTMPAWANNPRSDSHWGYRKTCRTAENRDNRDRLDVAVDLASFVERARRPGADVAAIVREARASASKAAGL